MASGAVVPTVGKVLLLERLFSSAQTVVSQFQIGTSSTTPANADTALGAKITAWNGGSDYGTFISSYPIYDTTNAIVTVKGQVGATQANSNTITENGLFNSDGTPVLASHDVHAGIVKNSSTEVQITWTFQITD